MNMSYKMELKINLGNYQNVNLVVDEMKSFEECQESFHSTIRDYVRNGIEITKPVLTAIGMRKVDSVEEKNK